MDKDKKQTTRPGLYLVSTPIGNMEDITLRALDVLKKSDIILCEDTRRSGKLLSYFQIKSKLIPYHKFNEKKASTIAIDFLKKNKIASLISDAGTPAISDPGMVLVNKCIEESINVYPIPGPSSASAAYSISGFGNQYIFYGFLSKQESEVEKVLKNLSNIDYSLIFFIPSKKIKFYISKFKKYFLNRRILIAREMTKIHEEFIRGDVESIQSPKDDLKGELTVVLSEIIREKKNDKEIHESVKIEIREMLKRYSHKDVVEFISKKENFSKKIIYDYCLKLKKEK